METKGIQVIEGKQGRIQYRKPISISTENLEADNGYCRAQGENGIIDIDFGPSTSNQKLIVHFGLSSERAIVELRFYGPENHTPQRQLQLRAPHGQLVEYVGKSFSRLVVAIAPGFPVSITSIGCCEVSGLETIVATRHPQLLRSAQQVKASATLARRTIAFAQRHGVGKVFFNRFRERLQNASPRDLKVGAAHDDLKDPARDVFGYSSLSGPGNTLRSVAIGTSSKGNFFMTEISRLLGCGFSELGLTVEYFDETSPPAPNKYDAAIIVAPHEFFVIDCPSTTFEILRQNSRLLMLNTEQPQTTWFAKALRYLKKADVVLDMNYQSAIQLRYNGIPALFVPLGHSPLYQEQFSNKPLRRSRPLLSLSQDLLNETPISFSERPIDILFVGTESDRRKDFFARNAEFFASRECFIYIPSGSDPFHADAPATIDFRQMIGLAQRSKIILNIHRDPNRYLEWQRVVNIGVFSGAAVLSETCEGNPELVPGLHYFDSPLEEMIDLCEQLLSNVEKTGRFAERASKLLAQATSMKTTLKKLTLE